MAGPGGTEVDRIAVRVVPNTEGFRKSLDRFIERMERTLRIRVRVVPDTRDFEDAVRRTRQRPARVPVEPDFDREFMTRVRRELAQAARAAGARIPLTPDGDVLRRELHRLISDAEGSTRVRFGADMDPEAMARLRRDIEDQIENVRRYGREWDDASRRVDRHRDTVERAGRGIDNSISNSFNTTITKIRRGFFTLGRILLLVAAIASPGLGLIVGLLASIPALVSAAGVAFAAVALGMDGIKRSAQQLRPELDALKASLSREWEDRLTPIFKQLKDSRIFATLDEGLRKTVNGLSDMVQGFTDVVTSARGMSQLQTILGKTGEFFSQLKGFTVDMTSAFLTMSESGANNFWKLSGSLNKFGQDFNALIQRLTTDGTFDRMFTGLSQTFDGLVVLFDKLFEAGARAMGSLGEPIGRFLASFGDFFLRTEPLFSSFAANLLNIGSQIFASLGPVLEKLTPSLTKLMDLIGNGLVEAIRILGQFLDPIAASLNSALLPAFKALEPSLPKLAQSFSDIAVSLGNGFAQAIDAIAPSLPVLVSGLGQLAVIFAEGLAQALPQLTPLFVQLVKVFADFLVKLEPLIPKLVEFAQTWVNEMITLLPQLTPLFERLITEVLPKLLDIVIAILPYAIQFLDWFIRALPYIEAFASRILDVAVPAIQFLLGVVSTVFDLIKGTVETVLDAIVTTIRTWKAIATGDWESAWNQMTGFLERTLSRWLTFLMDAADTFTNWFRELPQKAKDALGDLGSYLIDSGKALLRGFITGITLVIPEMLSTVRNALGALRDLFPFSPAKEGPFSGQGWVLYSGESVGEAFAEGMTSQQQKIVDAAKRMMQAAKDIFGDTGQLGLIIIVGAVDDASKKISETAKQTRQNTNNALTASTPKLDEKTKREVKDLELEADRLRIRIKELRQQADQEPDKQRAKQLKDEAKALQLQVDQLRLKAKELKNSPGDFGLDVPAVEKKTQEAVAAVDAASAQMKPKGKQLALDLNAGVEDGLTVLQKTLRAAANQIGEAFGFDDIGGKWDKAAEKAKFNDIPKNFMEATGKQFMSDLGVSGSGFLPQLFEQGAKIVYNVSSVQEVNAMERNRQTREKAQYLGR